MFVDNIQSYYYDSFTNVCLWGWKDGDSTEVFIILYSFWKCTWSIFENLTVPLSSLNEVFVKIESLVIFLVQNNVDSLKWRLNLTVKGDEIALDL